MSTMSTDNGQLGSQAEQEDEKQAKVNMDNMYRFTRHIYDLTRKYFLLGRDKLIDSLNARDEEVIIEVGCGTARNLIKMAKRYPNAEFHGLDASDEMLKTARQSIERSGLELDVKQAFAQSFIPEKLFDIKKPVTKLVFSYALSIIPPWKESIDHALDILPSGGEMHIVDFGNMQGHSPLFRRFMFWWLDLFHVYHKPEVLEYLHQLNAEGRGSITLTHHYKGYTYIAIFKKS